MSWFETGGLTNFAKSALSTAQKSIDRVLDIKPDDIEGDPGGRQQAGARTSTSTRSASRNDKSTGFSTRSKNDTLSPTSSKTNIKSDDSFFSAFLNDPTPSKSSAGKTKTSRTPGRVAALNSNTKKAQRQKSVDDVTTPERQETDKNEVSEVAQQPRGNRVQSEDISVGQVPCEVDAAVLGNENRSSSVPVEEKPIETGSTSLLDQSLEPLEISITEAGDMTGSTSSFVPISKEDVEDYQPAPVSPQSVDDLMSVSQTELREESENQEQESGKKEPDEVETEIKKEFAAKNRDGSPTDVKSEHSVETNPESHATSSSSDFVVINEFAGSEQSSLCNYDTRESPDNQSPKHFSSSSNGKRSPDSDFSIISEGRFHDVSDGSHQIPSLLDEVPFSSRRDSAAYSADVESEDQDEREVSAFDSSFKSLGSSDELREGSRTPTQEERQGSDAVVRKEEEAPCENTPRPVAVANADAANTNTAGMDQTHGDGPELSQNPLQPETLLKKLADMAQVLQAREAQTMTLSTKNADLQEAVNILKSQLQQAEEAREAEMTDVNQLTEEFTQRISSMEKKLQASQKERDTLKREVQRLTREVSLRDSNNQTEAVLREKDQTIRDLMAEGEKLSKQQLQNSNIIKKLRSKEKDNETVIKTQTEQLDEATKRVSHLEEVLDGKEELEKQQKDIIKKMNSAVERQEKEISNLRIELEDSTEKTRSTQAALDASYKDLAELHKNIATKDSQVQETQLSAEMNAKEELRLALERSQQEARREHESLLLQVSDLQMSLSRQEQQHARKEGHLRQEISDLQMRLQEAEARNQELSQSVSAATRPLLRQIENLNTTFNAQSGNWEQVERSLTERLAESQAQLASATEKERSATECALVAESKLSSLESQLALLRQDKSRLQAGLEMERAKVEALEEGKERDTARTEAQLSTYTRALEEAQREKAHLEKQLEVEKMRVEAERRKLLLAQEALNEKERRLTQQAEDSNSSHGNRSGASTPVHNLPSTPGPFHTPTQVDILERTMSWSTSGSLYDSIAGGSVSSVIEGLQSQLKQREGEIAQLQGEIVQLERTRASMAEEIVKLSNQNETLDEQARLVPEYKRKLIETETRYNAVLQMYGEKAEEVQELKLDLQDVKEMYRQQIEDLVNS
ncbi:TATA element modulatory factor-like isoform X2 [Acanthaster planci]|uniref:TATA element modulatory factor-like isoform X2 n=1 Tax=Acanthaster planci TaxID=133434 RepID=A0A8B7YM94_ACAPL|nr:TATA element modulatory factor-like isoform X2 [Acanthaster planci]